MRKIKSYQQFNEEINLKQLATGAALSGGLLMGSPATGQEVEPEPIVGKYGVNVMEEEKGTLVEDSEIKSGFEMLLKDPRVTVENEYSLIEVYDLADFDNYRVVVKTPYSKTGSLSIELEKELFISKDDFENYINGGKLSSSILYQLIDDEELIPDEFRKKNKQRRSLDSKTYRL